VIAVKNHRDEILHLDPNRFEIQGRQGRIDEVRVVRCSIEVGTVVDLLLDKE
jgi:hypothetical protein